MYDDLVAKQLHEEVCDVYAILNSSPLWIQWFNNLKGAVLSKLDGLVFLQLHYERGIEYQKRNYVFAEFSISGEVVRVHYGSVTNMLRELCAIRGVNYRITGTRLETDLLYSSETNYKLKQYLKIPENSVHQKALDLWVSRAYLGFEEMFYWDSCSDAIRCELVKAYIALVQLLCLV